MVRFAPAAAASWHAALSPPREPPDDEGVDTVDDRDGERVSSQDRLKGSAAQPDHGGEPAVAWRGRIHQRRSALRQARGVAQNRSGEPSIVIRRHRSQAA
jgi:hypothetical protein